MKRLSVETYPDGHGSGKYVPADRLEETRASLNAAQARIALIEMYLFLKLGIKIPEAP